ncbi:LysR family transcriptional regulator [Paenibacillus lupini]|uniref:LysR substrate-binding domain-containing protein n=1 Tax=Paenibacillus lupini TaxID=1450204 RepID=UPI0014244DFA|nr:LysR family transcriptional regulator [Paenibacillus lupini]NIK23350.1 DNA-binding transcriptional LysR family regulator [Paenibacillus lupini]
MDLKELTAFQTILKEGSFAKAAAKLNYAQSTITNQIQRLEKELGFQLFNRGWEAELTPAGRIYAAEVDRLIQHWHYVADQAKAVLQEETGTIHVGMLETHARQIMPEALQLFRETKPGVTCSFVIGNTDQLSTELRHQQIDFAICGEPSDMSELRFEPLYEEKIVFVAAENHPIHDHNHPVKFEDLLQHLMFVGGPTCLYYISLTKQFARHEKVPQLYSVSQISAIPGFVAQVPSVGAVLATTPLPKGVIPVPVDWDPASIPVGLLQKRETIYPSIACEQLKKRIKEVIATHY